MFFYLLLILCSIISYFLIFKNKDYWKKRNVTQVNGTFWKFLFSQRSFSEILKEVYDEHNDSQIGLFMGNKPALIIKDLKDIQTVLAGEFQNFYSRGVVKNPNEILAENILFIEDFQKWKVIRSKFSPVFTSLRLKTMFVVIEKCARDFVELISNDKKMKDKPFDAIYTYAAASIGASVFGIDSLNGKNTMDSPFLEMAKKSVEPSLSINIWLSIGNYFPKLLEWFNFKFFGEHENFFINAVKQVLKYRLTAEKKPDFIDLCLELKKKGVMTDPQTGYQLQPTDEVLAAQAFFFFIAGVDPTANAIQFTLLELASNPNVLQKLHKEIDSVFEDDKEELSYQDLDKMQYLDMVLSEAMRKYPPIGQIQRRCMNDTMLPSNNLKIEKDTIIIIPIYAIHRDENLYPERFDPERFDPNAMKVQKYSYLAFGDGNRFCLGTRFSRLQMKAALAWLFRKFTLVERPYDPKTFVPSPFLLRDADPQFTLIPRNI